MALNLLFFVLITSVIIQTATSSTFKSIYLVTVSSEVVGGTTEKLCAQVHQATEPLLLKVSLEMEGGSGTILLEEDVTQDFYRCISFQVPPVKTDSVATVHVSIKGRKDEMSKKTKILIKPKRFLTIFQTDKPVYKPGQTVKFRIVSLDASFLSFNQMYLTVELQDPNSNRIAQWLNQSTVSGILDLSHPMSTEATQGSYIITAWNEKGEQTSQTFDIKEYVLPKYEVKVYLPQTITILDKQATLRVCGKYTYGKPVLGSVTAKVCRIAVQYYWLYESSNICEVYLIKTDKTGCATQMIDLTRFRLRESFGDFEVETEMEEYGTGVILKGSGKASFTNVIVTVRFEDVPQAYKPGIAYEGKIKVTGPDSSPVPNEPVYLFLQNSGKSENWTLTTDSKGIASFSLDTSLWSSDSVSLSARYQKVEKDYPYVQGVRRPEYSSDYHFAREFYSKSKSFVKIMQGEGKFSCEKDGIVLAHYIIQGVALKKGQTTLDFFYLVISRGSIWQHGRLPVTIKERKVNQGQLMLSLQRMPELTPFAQVVVYTVLPDGEAVADSQDFPIHLCLKNKVSLKFSSLQELPGEKTSLSLQAHPGSLCSLRAIDQSVLLLQPEQELSLDSVFSQLPVQKLSGYSYMVEDPYPCLRYPPRFEEAMIMPLPPVPELVDELVVPDWGKRSFRFGPSDDKNDVYSIFKEVGIKILTNSDVKKPYDCNTVFAMKENGMMEARPMNMMLNEESAPTSGASDRPKETVRTYFPETWIWDLVPVGRTGKVNVEKTVPDTITKWAAGAFCTSPVGFGLAPNTGLTAFQPFFVSLTLPYSVIRGEMFTLKATVFNYLSKCIMVKVTLAESNQFKARPCEGCQYTLCLCAEESRTFKWILTPTALGAVSVKVSAEALKTEKLCGNEVATVPEKGRIDTVVQTLLVEAEGTQETVSHNALLCPAEGPVEKDISLKLPKVFVEGSAKASLSVLGDLMGRAMKNLHSLLQMPYGCGEQNMVLFAPNIYILNYLQSTRQLTKEIQTRATGFLDSGYQRELNYKHDDGSYSAFGKSDESGNTWLTSFVLKSFGGAKPYIFVDPAHIAQAKAWLASHQQTDGCIASVGKLFHNGMKGGVGDQVSLTAYITAALLELDGNTSDPMVEKSLMCLKAAVSDKLENTYTMALLSYTFTLAQNQDMRAKLITHLDKIAATSGGNRHWERPGASGTKTDSLEVEMTSYVLLALLSGPTMPGFGLDYSTGIVRWLAQQQNPYGGFASTQDTVVALQALAKYGAATFSPEGASTVSVSSAGGLKMKFTVNQNNRLLYQEEQLREVPGDYNIKAQGKSCVFVQIAMHYNIPPPPDFSAFNISTQTLGKCDGTQKSLIVSVAVRYNGRREETNMVIINVKLLSGFVLDKSSLGPLKNDPTVKRVDLEEGHVIIYLDGLKQKETKTYSLAIEEDVPVRNLKPAVVKVYDYYQTSDEAVSEYSSPCAE
ncbi:alpha-2-macroglobulin-like isoform X2 [Oncorhynchus mykiss]|uniref:alpha-2-macroglobulin-like isoform X1 n=1 Tax=Oncorhynchus mykiss TaxID=8022 RepID=UPI001877BE84|nr:alpha-2-macroglobulin-like isoform X1 [Oncorhynchus mykiss]XP_036817830.1 alpha-2-macroglobulin-like isoform X2 [Oncorhynchus mykiss]